MIAATMEASEMDVSRIMWEIDGRHGISCVSFVRT
jgi:hypothetical protein